MALLSCRIRSQTYSSEKFQGSSIDFSMIRHCSFLYCMKSAYSMSWQKVYNHIYNAISSKQEVIISLRLLRCTNNLELQYILQAIINVKYVVSHKSFNSLQSILMSFKIKTKHRYIQTQTDSMLLARLSTHWLLSNSTNFKAGRRFIFLKEALMKLNLYLYQVCNIT